tara:strand:+ start:376 stop:738 length:363 start_codon:yes stop_codon:yes gene_type:complete
MPSFTIIVDGKKYKTEATSEKAAEKKIKDHLKKNVKASKSAKQNNKKTKGTKPMSRTIIDYKIISSEKHFSLQTTVKGYIEDGWQPQGGVGVVDYQGKGLVGGIGRYEFFQAIVKYSKYK